MRQDEHIFLINVILTPRLVRKQYGVNTGNTESHDLCAMTFSCPEQLYKYSYWSVCCWSFHDVCEKVTFTVSKGSRVLSGMYSAFEHPLISGVISWRCFLAVLILAYACGAHRHRIMFVCFLYFYVVAILLRKYFSKKICSHKKLFFTEFFLSQKNFSTKKFLVTKFF